MTTASAQCTVELFGQIVVTAPGNLTITGDKVTSGNLIIDADSYLETYKTA